MSMSSLNGDQLRGPWGKGGEMMCAASCPQARQAVVNVIKGAAAKSFDRSCFVLTALSARPFHSDGSGLHCGFECQIYGPCPSPDTGSSGGLHSRTPTTNGVSPGRFTFGTFLLFGFDTSGRIENTRGVRRPGTLSFCLVAGFSLRVCLRFRTLTLHTLCCR